MRRSALFSLILLACLQVKGQGFSNKGKDFYLCFPSHLPSGGNLAQMSLFITSDKNSSGVVTYNGQVQNFVVTANQVTEVPIDRNTAYITDAESNAAINKGIRVKVNAGQAPVVVYSHIYAGFRTAATLVLPVNVLSRKYRAISYYQASTGVSKSQFQVIAVEDNTTVEIQLRRDGALFGAPFTITLPTAGNVWQVQDDFDLSGSSIESVAGAGGSCKKIAVFSGSSSLSLGRQGCNAGSFDPLNQQCYPTSTWGKRFGVIPIVNNQSGYQARVMAAEDLTVVNYGGTTVTLNEGEVYPPVAQNVAAQTQPIFISADKPICVTQYLMSQNCAANPQIGDPDMIILNPIEQNIDNITIFTSTKQAIQQQHMNVLIKTPATGSFKINGVAPGAAFFQPMPADPSFSYYQHTFNVGQNSYTLTADSGFNAICYGLGGAESYGYSAGTNVKDLYQFGSTQNDDTTLTGTFACKGVPFFLYQTFPFQPTQIKWTFYGLFADVTLNAPVHDSTYFVNGVQVWRYKNPNQYVSNTPGQYDFDVDAINPTPDGCNGLQEITHTLDVSAPPVASFDWIHTGCVTDTVYFRENTVFTDGHYVRKWRWLFHDGLKDSVKTPKKLYPTAGSFDVKLQVVTEVGCKSDTLPKTINLSSLPVAAFTASTPRCVGKPVTFTPTSSLAVGILEKWVYDWGDGSPVDTVLNGNPVQHTFLTGGPITVRHLVISSTGCRSLPVTLPVTINVNPRADFVLPANICMPSGLAAFANSTTISDGSLPTVTYVWNFGDATPTSTAVSPTHNYAATGPYSVTLSATSANGCVHDTVKVVNNFRPQPTAGFTNNPEICLSDSLQFTSTSNGNGGTITQYFWDFGDGNTSTLANPKHKWATPGTKTIRHWIVTDQGCPSDTLPKTIVVNQLPTADFSFPNANRCARVPITFTSSSVPNDGNLVEWSWDFGDGSPLVAATNGNPINHTYSIPGSYTVTLTVKTDKGCVSTPTPKTLVITATPVSSFILPGGICLPAGNATFTNNTTISDGTLPTVTYVWDFGDGSPTVTTNSPTHIYAGTGPYTVKLTATSAIGCVDDSSQVLSTIFPQPKADFTSAPETCLSDSLQFTDNSNPLAGTVAQYFWDFGDGSPINTQQNPKHKWATPGTKTIRHWVITSNNCMSDTMPKTIFVNRLPTAAFSFSATRCEQLPVTFTSNAVPNDGNLAEWTWDFGDGTGNQVFTNGNPVTHTYAAGGSYTVTLTVKTDKGCVSAPLPLPVTVNVKPRASFTPPANVCLPAGTAAFINTTTISDGTLPAVTYVWNFGDATPTSTVVNPTHNYTATGPFNVLLTATSGNGCVDDTTIQLANIWPQPTAGFTNNAEVCLSDSLQFTDASTPNGGVVTEYFWDFGDGSPISNLQNPKHKWATAGTKTVRHWIRTDKGCYSDTLPRTITVNRLPTASFTIAAPYCVGRDVSFTSTAVPNDGAITTWRWNLGDGTTPTNTNGNTFSHVYVPTGSYTITLEVETDKGCVSNPNASQTIIIRDTAEVDFSMPEICLDDPTAQFFDSSTIADGTQAQFTYLWNFGDPNANAGNPNTSTTKNPTHRYTAAANYNMWLEVTTVHGCKSRRDTVFTVNGSTPVASFTVQNPANLCSNKDVVIQNTSTVNFGNVTKVEIFWDWTGNPTLKTVDDTPTPGKLYNFDYPDFGTPPTRTYTIRLLAYSGGICVDPDERIITVLGSPNVVFNAVPDICEENGAAQLVQASETTGIPGAGVFSGPGVSAGGNFNPSTAGVGTHLIRYTFTAANGCSTFKEQTVAVNPTPNVTAGPDRTVLEGGSVTLLGGSTSTGVSYTWTPITGLSGTTVAQPSASPPDDIVYTVTATSDKGCRASDQVEVKVLKGPRVPNVFTPNGDGVNDRWDIQFLDTYVGCVVEVYNRYGQRVYRSVGYSKAWDGTYNGNPMPVGTYYYIIEPKNGRQPITGYVDIVR